MGDQGIEGGAALRLVKPGDGAGIGRISAKAVDGFGRKRDNPPPSRQRAAVSAAPSAGIIAVFKSSFIA